MDNDFWRQIFPATPADSAISLGELLFRLLLALALGSAIAAIYRLTQRPDSPAASSFISTLVLLTVLLAMVTQVIGNSAARAFSLVGILSIVRFRTTVEDTRDTAFVIFAVILGMAAGVDNREVAYLGLAVVGAAALALRYLPLGTPQADVDWVLLIRVSTGAGAATPWEDTIAKHCQRHQLVSTATARQGTVLELSYRVRLKANAAPLQLLNELNRVEGIQNLELKKGA
jgi:hypothetical protein